MSPKELNKIFLSPNSNGYKFLSKFYYKYYDIFVNTSYKGFNDFSNQISLNLSAINFSSKQNNINEYIISVIKIQCRILYEKAVYENKNEKNNSIFNYINLFKLTLNPGEAEIFNYLIDGEKENLIAEKTKLKLNAINKSIKNILSKLYNYLQKSGVNLSQINDDELNNYIKYLDEVKDHLPLSALTTYSKLYNLLSEKEKKFIEKHLSVCPECKTKLEDIFDEDFDLDDRIEKAELKRHWHKDSTSQEFINSRNGCTIQLSANKGNLNLFIKALPESYYNKNLRFITGTGKTICRIISAETGQIFIIDKTMNLELVNRKIAVQLFKTETSQRLQDIKNKINPVMYAAAAFIFIALIITIYFSLIQRENFNLIIKKQLIITDSSSFIDTSKFQNVEPSAQINQHENNSSTESNHLENDFIENSILENFINRNMKASNKIVLIQPRINQVIKKMPVKFIWNGNSEKLYNLIIVNNKNQKIYSRRIKGTVFKFSNNLKPGLYYWELESDDILLAVSKFAVLP